MATADQIVSAVLEATNKAYIVETGDSEDGLSHYRRWSDGTVEQWGYGKVSGNTLNVTFPIAFKDTSYIALAFPRNSQLGGDYVYASSSNLSEASASFYMRGSNSPSSISWYVKGYAN